MEETRESVFITALKSFCRMFFGTIGLIVAIVVICIGYAAVSSVSVTESKTTINYLPDLNGKREYSLTSPVILQLNIDGVIGVPKVLDSEIVQNILLDSRTGTLSTDRVKGILIYMNSPGGGATDSDTIYRMIKQYKERYKVPVYAYVEGMCASGGMYIAASADQIYAGPASIIGSVGVIVGPFFNVYETMLKVGMNSKTLTAGIDKDMMSPYRPWKEDEAANLKEVTDAMYNRFVEVVVTNRPRLDRDKLVGQYGARVFDGAIAQEYGYIDVANSDRDAALAALLEAAKVDPHATYQVVELKPQSAVWSALTSKSPFFTGKIEHSVDLGGPKIKDKIAYLYLNE